jgi:hypothetical protein
LVQRGKRHGLRIIGGRLGALLRNGRGFNIVRWAA